MVAVNSVGHRQTYESISSVAINSTTTSINFSNIPQNYTDLILVCNLKGSALNYPAISYNGVGNASRLWFTRNSTFGLWTGTSNDGYITGGLYLNTGNFASTTITHVFNYSNNTTHKVAITQSVNTSVEVGFVVSNNRSTSPITSMNYFFNGGGVESGSTLSLYGIKAA